MTKKRKKQTKTTLVFYVFFFIPLACSSQFDYLIHVGFQVPKTILLFPLFALPGKQTPCQED